jgi:hypothetical protein
MECVGIVKVEEFDRKTQRRCTHHGSTKCLWDELRELLGMPVYGRLLVVQVGRTGGWSHQHAKAAQRLLLKDSLERCDFGVKTAALAALGEIAAFRCEGVTEPLGAVDSGVKDGESTLKRFFAFSLWLSLVWSWMYGQAEKVSPGGSAGTAASTYCSRSGNARIW